MPSSQSLFQSRILRATALLGAVLVGQSALAADAAPVGEVKHSEPMQKQLGYGREHCLNLAAGSTFTFTTSTPYAVDFNFHHHPAQGATTFPVRETVTQSLTKTLTITDGGNYCFQWINPAERPFDFPVTVTYQVK